MIVPLRLLYKVFSLLATLHSFQSLHHLVLFILFPLSFLYSMAYLC